MPEDIAGREPDRLTHVETVRLLSCEFEIRTNSRDLYERLAYVVQRSDQNALPVAERYGISVLQSGDAFEISGDDGSPTAERSLADALEALFVRLHRRALEMLPDHIRIHAASGLHDGRAFLIVGPKRAGKTTLALRLLVAGFDIVGDELVLLRGGETTTFPRRFYVRNTTLPLLPPLPPAPGATPFTMSPSEGRLIAVDPTRFGRPWRIVAAEVSTILYLQPNHGCETFTVPCEKVEMVRRVMSECAAPPSGRKDWIADLCRTVDRARTFTVHIGTLDSAVLEVRRMLG